MAAFEDLTTCPICFEMYKNPQSLSCLHVLCKSCVDQLSKDGSLECPTCRTSTKVEQIKCDFNKQTLIDVYLSQVPDNEKVNQSVHSTESCKEENKQLLFSGILSCSSCDDMKKVEFKCEECQILMCLTCHKAHCNFPATAQHQIIEITHIKESIKTSIRECIKQLDEECTRLKMLSLKQADYLQALEEKKVSAIDYVNRVKDNLKEQIDNQHMKQLSQFDLNMSEISDRVEEEKRQIDMNVHVLRNKGLVLCDMIEKDDTSVLLNTSDQLQSEALSALRDIRSEVEHIKETSLPDVKIKEADPWNAEKGSEILVTCSDTEIENEEKQLLEEIKASDFIMLHTQPTIDKSQDRNAGFLKMLDGNLKFEKCQSIELGYKSKRLVEIGETLWCTGEHGAYIYDKNLNFIVSVHNERVKDATCITKDYWGNIIAASHWKLHQLDSSSKYVAELCIGNFSDIVANDHILYALDSRMQKIHIFEYKEPKRWFQLNQGKKWTNVKTINLERAKQTLKENKNRNIQNIVVTKDTIYAGSWEGSQHCLYKIYKAGSQDVLVQITMDEAKQKFFEPKLCASDCFGNVLVANGKSSHLQICTQDGQWEDVELNGSNSIVEDAVMDISGQLIWTITKNSHLVKFQVVQMVKKNL